MAERIAVGYVTRTKGVRGEVKVEVLSHDPDRFAALSSVVLERPDGRSMPLRIDRWRLDAPGIRVKFDGVDTPEEAKQQLVGGYLTIAPDQVAPLPDKAYYVFDLLGCRVEDEAGRDLGKVVEVQSMPTVDVYIVRGETEFMLPAASDFLVEVDTEGRRIVVRGVEELLA